MCWVISWTLSNACKTVALVLNLTTGLVSPQFHIKYDDFFETVNKSEFNLPIEWKTKCHFVKVPIKPQEYPIEDLTSLIKVVVGSVQDNADEQIPLELIPNTVLESPQGGGGEWTGKADLSNTLGINGCPKPRESTKTG
jgi:hypothetical protein